jgi:hypothetical protein
LVTLPGYWFAVPPLVRTLSLLLQLPLLLLLHDLATQKIQFFLS